MTETVKAAKSEIRQRRREPRHDGRVVRGDVSGHDRFVAAQFLAGRRSAERVERVWATFLDVYGAERARDPIFDEHTNVALVASGALRLARTDL